MHATRVTCSRGEEFGRSRRSRPVPDHARTCRSPKRVIDFRETAVELAQRIAGARHVELDWAGHLPSLERPAELNPLLLDFLRA